LTDRTSDSNKKAYSAADNQPSHLSKGVNRAWALAILSGGSSILQKICKATHTCQRLSAPSGVQQSDQQRMSWRLALKQGLVDTHTPITLLQARTVYLSTVRPELYRHQKVFAVPLCCSTSSPIRSLGGPRYVLTQRYGSWESFQVFVMCRTPTSRLRSISPQCSRAHMRRGYGAGWYRVEHLSASWQHGGERQLRRNRA
jgi:hypothetical protein